MRVIRAVAIATAAGLIATGAACSSKPPVSNDLTPPPANTSGTLKVWLMGGGAPDTVLNSVNAQFKQMYPNVTVQVETQQWAGIQDKYTTSLNTTNTPCVAEFGNSLIAKYSDAGLLSDLTSVASSMGADKWLPGTIPPGMLDGKRYTIPFYSGDRVLIYNKAHFAKAGIAPPKTLDELSASAAKLSQVMGTPASGYSAWYFPGQYWYAALPFVWEYGGDIAVQDGGQWKGLINDPGSQKGLGVLNDLVQKYSTAPKDGDEKKNAQAFASGKVGMMMDQWWDPDAIVKQYPQIADQVGVIALPGLTAKKSSPVFLGGSDLGVPFRCPSKGLAVQWIKLMTNLQNQTAIAAQGGLIPNQKEAFVGFAGKPFLQTAATAAEVSRFTPVAPTWANVEAQNILPDMLVRIFTQQATIPEATDKASGQVANVLNGG